MSDLVRMVGEYARYANIALALIVLIKQGRQLYKVWFSVAADVRLRWLALLMFAFVGGYGSAESLLLGVPIAPRTVLLTVAMIWAVVASFVPRRLRQWETDATKSDRSKP